MTEKKFEAKQKKFHILNKELFIDSSTTRKMPFVTFLNLRINSTKNM